MPIFFFDVHDGVSCLDGCGVECRDVEEAGRRALQRAERLLADQADWFCTGQEWQIGVVDPSGKTVLDIAFKATGGARILVSMQAGLLVGRWSCEHLERALDRSGRQSRSPAAPARGPPVSRAGSAVEHACAAPP